MRKIFQKVIGTYLKPETAESKGIKSCTFLRLIIERYYKEKELKKMSENFEEI